MKILVLMKQVANKDAILRINKDSTWIEEADLSFEVSESDGYALEEALRIKEKVAAKLFAARMARKRERGGIREARPGAGDGETHTVGDGATHLPRFAAPRVRL